MMRKRIDFGYMHQNPPSDACRVHGRKLKRDLSGNANAQGAVLRMSNAQGSVGWYGKFVQVSARRLFNVDPSVNAESVSNPFEINHEQWHQRAERGNLCWEPDLDDNLPLDQGSAIRRALPTEEAEPVSRSSYYNCITRPKKVPGGRRPRQ